MKPTIGRIVIYIPTEQDKEEMKNLPACNVMDELPAIITAVWSDTLVNLSVILDGDATMWKTSVPQGDDEYNWKWPEKV